MTRPSLSKPPLSLPHLFFSRPHSTTTYHHPLTSLTPTHLSYYWDTHPPTPSDLLTANTLFTPSPPHTPVKLFSTSKFRTTPLSTTTSKSKSNPDADHIPIPEVAFLGRSNVGKSSLLNALMGVKGLCWTSSKPGRTKVMNGFGIGARRGGESGMDSRVVVLDMPGYGKGSREEWGVEILKYLRGRRRLRRTFLLIDSHHGLKPLDHQLLSLLRQSCIPHQIILSKVDKILLPRSSSSGKSQKELVRRGVSEERLKELRGVCEGLRGVVQPQPQSQPQLTTAEGPGALGEILACSSETPGRDGVALGIEGVRWAVCSAVGIDGRVEGRRESGSGRV